MEKAVLITLKESAVGGGKEQETDLLNQAAERLRSGKDTTVQNLLKSDYEILEVQYNPVSVKMDAGGGDKVLKTMSSNQDAASISQVVNAQRTTLSVDLIFDGPKTQSAMRQCLTSLLGASVRKVIFCWGFMAFPGTVTRINMTYTMFSETGSPIFGKIAVSFLQSGSSKEEDAYWEKAYKKMK